MKRTKFKSICALSEKPIKMTPVRKNIIQNVKCYFAHWGEQIYHMSNEFLLAHTHPVYRTQLAKDLDEEIKAKLKEMETA